MRHKTEIALAPRAPFHFDATMHKPDHFPAADNAWEPGVRWQTARWQGRALGLKFEDQGTVDQPRIRLSVWSEEALDRPTIDGLLDEVRYRYNLDLVAFEAVYAAVDADWPAALDVFRAAAAAQEDPFAYLRSWLAGRVAP